MPTKPLLAFKRAIKPTRRIIAYLVAGALFGAVLASCLFIYQHIYTTLEDTSAVAVLNASTQANVIDAANYRKAAEALSMKLMTPPMPPALRNIFVYSSSTPTTAAPTSSSLPHAL